MYPSMKPLAAWTRDLVQRIEQLNKWSETAHPPIIFWMSGFTFPTGFLTAVLQTSARQYNVLFILFNHIYIIILIKHFIS
jgi:dynein heavy chain, axonemal